MLQRLFAVLELDGDILREKTVRKQGDIGSE